MARPDRNPIELGASVLDRRRTSIAVEISCALLLLASGSARAEIFLDAPFTTGPDGFAYGDDSFRSTNAPGHASGNHLPAGGETGGGLQIALGNVDSTTVNGMSGGWSRSFVLDLPTDEVELSFRFNLSQTPDYESDELSQVMVAVDGVLLPGAGVDFVAQVVGNGNGGAVVTTGWSGFARNLGSLEAGPHTILIGAYNSKKTFDNEATDARFDDLLVTGNPISACVVAAECDDANPCTDDVCNVGTCGHSNNTLACDDGVGCTGGDVCSAGLCGGPTCASETRAAIRPVGPARSRRPSPSSPHSTRRASGTTSPRSRAARLLSTVRATGASPATPPPSTTSRRDSSPTAMSSCATRTRTRRRLDRISTRRRSVPRVPTRCGSSRPTWTASTRRARDRSSRPGPTTKRRAPRSCSRRRASSLIRRS